MTCRQTREFLFAFLDNELDAPRSIDLQLHLDGCPDCAREAEIERATKTHLAGSLEQTDRPVPAFDVHAVGDETRARRHIPVATDRDHSTIFIYQRRLRADADEEDP